MLRRTPQEKAHAASRLRDIFGCIPKFRLVKVGHATGLCPSHDDHKPSLGIWAGDWHEYTWSCQAECDPTSIRADLETSYRIAAESLGGYCDRDQRGQRPIRSGTTIRLPTSYEAARLRADLLAVLADPTISRITDLRMRLLLAIEGGRELPSTYKEFVALGKRAGAKPTQVKELAKSYVSTGPG